MTTRKLTNRVSEHLGDLRHMRNKNALVKHCLDLPRHNKFKFFVVEGTTTLARGGDLDNILRVREARWQILLDASIPPGLNDMVNLAPFLTQRRNKI